MEAPPSAPSGEVLRLQLLGSPCLLRLGGGVIELNRLDAALMALLVLEAGCDRPRAAALLWPDAGARRAGLSLRQRIFRLRRAASADVVTGTARLGLAPFIDHDLGLLHGGVPPPASLPPRGELLGALDYAGLGELGDWVSAARERWRTARREALAGAAARFEREGRLAPALRAAERLLEHEPHSEHAHRRVMRLHYLRGDRSAALDAFQRCRDALGQLLGEVPGAETLALAQAIGEVAGPEAAAPALPVPVTLLRPPRLVGRQAEWRRLAAAQARGQPVLLTGEPGIGKTRLLAERVQACGPGLLVDARPGDRRVPHALIARLLLALADGQGPPPEAGVRAELARLQPAFGSASAGPLEPARLQAAIASELTRAAAGGMRLLALDDLQFADEASLDVLLPLASGAHGAAWLLAARRAGQPAALQAWLAEATAAGRAEELPLPPLAPDGVAALVDSLTMPGLETAAWAEALQRRTGGHPMMLLETLRAALTPEGKLPARPGSLPWPDGLDALIEVRLQALGDAARRLMQVAALADVDFSAELAARALQVHVLDLAAPWRELEAAGIFAGAGFAHDLVREAVLRAVPAPVAQVLHARIADLIGAGGAAAVRVAEHRHRAGDWAAAATAWRQAAEEALAAGRRREEGELLRAAADDFRRAAARAGAEESASWTAAALEAECERIGALVQCADGDELRLALQQLQAIPSNAAQQARIAVAVAEAQIVFGEFDAVAAAMPAAIAALSGDAQATVLATRRLAVALLNLGRPTDAAQAMDACLPRLAELSSDRARYEFLAEFGTVLERCNRRREGFGHLRHGIALALQARDHGTAATMYVNLGVNRVYWGDVEAAIAATERGLSLRQQHDGLGGLASGMDMTLGAMCRDAGRLGEAIERLERSHAAFLADGNRLWVANAAAHLALLWLQLGQRARAARVLQLDLAGLPAFIAARVTAARALHGAAADRPALPGLDAALSALAGADRADVRLGIQLERIRLLDPAAALSLAGDVAAEARGCELMGHAFGADVLATDALRRAGRSEDAAVRAHALAADGDGLAPSGFHRPALWLALQQALRAAGAERAGGPLIGLARTEVGRSRASLPAAFHDSFDRHPVHRALMQPRTPG